LGSEKKPAENPKLETLVAKLCPRLSWLMKTSWSIGR
jgi:hypothetical protein